MLAIEEETTSTDHDKNQEEEGEAYKMDVNCISKYFFSIFNGKVMCKESSILYYFHKTREMKTR